MCLIFGVILSMGIELGARWCGKHGAPRASRLFIFIISHHGLRSLGDNKVICVLDGVNKPREYIWPLKLK
jgi:hypothetical protein